MTPQGIRTFAFAMLGGCLGFIYSCIFLLLYYFQEFDMPVTDAFRMKSSLVITTVIVVVVLAIANYRHILNYLKSASETLESYEDEDYDEDDSE